MRHGGPAEVESRREPLGPARPNLPGTDQAPAADRGFAADVHDTSGKGVPREVRMRRSLPVLGRVYLACVFAATAAIAGPLLGQLPHTHGWRSFFVFGAAAAAAQLFPAFTPRDQTYHSTIVFSCAAAIVLPLPLVALIGVVAHVPEWLKVRYRWYIQTFNICMWTLTLLAASASARFVRHDLLGVGSGLRFAIAGLVACSVLVAVNHSMLAVMLYLARGHSPRESGLFSAENVSTDLVLGMMGIGVAYLWLREPWMAVFAVAPLLLIHRSLRLPRLEAETRIDPKTGLFNARHLTAALGAELERASRRGSQVSVIMADLDLLRDINNRHGHLAGDAVLLGIADVLRRELRPYDVPARFGGDEFAILLPETSPERAAGIGERIRQAVADMAVRPATSHGPIQVTVSIGVADFPGDAKDAAELMHQADIAVYRAKAQGQNRVVTAGRDTAPAPVGLSFG
jgi:diguanylate cyclase (GGDEF)-like protein